MGWTPTYSLYTHQGAGPTLCPEHSGQRRVPPPPPPRPSSGSRYGTDGGTRIRAARAACRYVPALPPKGAPRLDHASRSPWRHTGDIRAAQCPAAQRCEQDPSSKKSVRSASSGAQPVTTTATTLRERARRDKGGPGRVRAGEEMQVGGIFQYGEKNSPRSREKESFLSEK